MITDCGMDRLASLLVNCAKRADTLQDIYDNAKSLRGLSVYCAEIDEIIVVSKDGTVDRTGARLKVVTGA